jgi:hypothetical protein
MFGEPKEGSKKPGALIVSLMSKKDGGDEKEAPGEPAKDASKDVAEPEHEDGEQEEGQALAANMLDAMKTDDPSSFYAAFTALMDHHLAKDDKGEEPDSGPLLPSSGDDEE